MQKVDQYPNNYADQKKPIRESTYCFILYVDKATIS